MDMEKIGVWSFYAGLVLAIVAAFAMQGNTMIPWVLGILGIVVGLLNVTDKETSTFLVATIALVVSASSLGSLFSAWGSISAFLMNVVTFVAPGAAVVALKAIWDITKSK